MLTLQEVLNDFATYAHIPKVTVSIHSMSANGESPLHWMATLGDVSGIRILLAAGASVLSADKDGNTPLHVAAAFGHFEAAAALLNAGALPSKHNIAGETPEDVARERRNAVMLKLFSGR